MDPYQPIYPPLDTGPPSQVPGQQSLQNQHATPSPFAQYMYGGYNPSIIPAPPPLPAQAPQPVPQPVPQAAAQINHRPLAPALVLSTYHTHNSRVNNNTALLYKIMTSLRARSRNRVLVV